MTPNWKTNYWSKPIVDKKRCDICHGLLNYDVEGNCSCPICGYKDIPCPSCGSYNTKQVSPFPFTYFCNTCGARFAY